MYMGLGEVQSIGVYKNLDNQLGLKTSGYGNPKVGTSATGKTGWVSETGTYEGFDWKNLDGLERELRPVCDCTLDFNA
ncbi:hypothetical protein IJD44_09585 [bacterium]|nr:hypothetical protein [bacterium]